MKRIVLSMACAGMIFGAQAQISIGQYGVVSAGNQVTFAYDTLAPAGLFISESGPDQVWDYSNFQEEVTYETEFIPAQWTPYGNDFPNSTAAEPDGQGGFVYYTQNSAGLTVDGIAQDADGDGSIDIIPFSDKLEALDFILEYGDQHRDTAQISLTIPGDGIQFDSATFSQMIDYQYTIDAYGSMTTPYGTFNSLRLKIITTVVDTLYVYPVVGPPILQDASRNTGREYEWYSNDPGSRYLVFEVGVNDQDSILNGGYLKEMPTVGIEEEAFAEFEAFPNPASSQFTLKTQDEDYSGNLMVFDVTGRMMGSFLVQGGQVLVPVSDWENGFYTYQIIGDHTQEVLNGKFLVSH